MLSLGLKLTVLLAAILTLLALAPGHEASASLADLSGPWVDVYSESSPTPNVNVADCSITLVQDTGNSNHYTASGASCVNSNGVPTLSGGTLNAMLTGTTLAGSFGFTTSSIVGNFSGTVSADGTSISNGVWNETSPSIASGTFSSAKQQSTPAGAGQMVAFPNAGPGGADLTFVGPNTGGQTGIVTAPTAGGNVPPQFQLVGQYYHVITSVPHGPPGPYIFCAGYNETPSGSGLVNGTPEGNIHILHWDASIGAWGPAEPRYLLVDAPPYSDAGTNRVCASVDHLSDFALVTPTASPTPTPSPTPPPPPPLDHFKCYLVQGAQPRFEQVTLTDQFETETGNLSQALRVCNPVQKTHNNVITPITNPDSHLVFYAYNAPPFGPPEPTRVVSVTNQFGTETLTVTYSTFLAVPSQKQPFGPPSGLSHFKCYFVTGQPLAAGTSVDLLDQFHSEPNTPVLFPRYLCNPVQKVHNGQTFPILDPVTHLVCYIIDTAPFNTTTQTNNQFGPENLQVFSGNELCVPSTKEFLGTPTPEPTPTPTPTPTQPPTPSPTPVPTLDHFKCYTAHTQGFFGPTQVTLTDQFETGQYQVIEPNELCNPVQKTHDGSVTPITNPDSHLLIYPIQQVSPDPEPTRFVDIQNQFGNQQLILNNAQFLMVPTQKQPFGPPHNLDHYKCYFAAGQPINATVDLLDQFHAEPGVQVLQPAFFCNPAEKIHNGQTFPILNAVDHLTCYYIAQQQPFQTMVQTDNQFNEDSFIVTSAVNLCVPSLKLAVNTATPLVTDSPTPVVTDSPTPIITNSPTPVVTNSPTPVVTNSPTPVVTNSPTPVVTNSPTPVVTNSPTPVVTNSPTPVVTNSPTPVVTNSPTPVVTNSPTPVVTNTPTPHPTGAVGGFVDVVTGGQSGSGGLSLLALAIILMVISTASGGAAYAYARRRQ